MNGEMGLVVAFHRPPPAHRASINITGRMGPTKTLDEIEADIENNVRETSHLAPELERREIGDCEALIVTYPPEKGAGTMQAIVVKGAYEHVITCGSDLSQFDVYRPMFIKCIDSFRFAEP